MENAENTAVKAHQMAGHLEFRHTVASGAGYIGSGGGWLLHRITGFGHWGVSLSTGAFGIQQIGLTKGTTSATFIPCHGHRWSDKPTAASSAELIAAGGRPSGSSTPRPVRRIRSACAPRSKATTNS